MSISLVNCKHTLLFKAASCRLHVYTPCCCKASQESIMLTTGINLHECCRCHRACLPTSAVCIAAMYISLKRVYLFHGFLACGSGSIQHFDGHCQPLPPALVHLHRLKLPCENTNQETCKNIPFSVMAAACSSRRSGLHVMQGHQV